MLCVEVERVIIEFMGDLLVDSRVGVEVGKMEVGEGRV